MGTWQLRNFAWVASMGEIVQKTRKRKEEPRERDIVHIIGMEQTKEGVRNENMTLLEA